MASDVLECVVSKDPTWHFAYHYVRKNFDVPSHIYRLLKAGWNGEAVPLDYVKILGFSNLNPGCLLQAAELSGSDNMKGRGAVERAITFLGIRFTSVVLGIHLYTNLFLKKSPPLGWRSFLQDMIKDVEYGYKFGSHAAMLGSEAGSLCGFAPHAGLGLVMATEPDRHKEYMALRRSKPKLSGKDEVEVFGCELYQLSTLIAQQLGFGTEFAMGVALSSGRFEENDIELGEETYQYEAAIKWIEALKLQNNYPPEQRHRTTFSELVPPKPGGERNKRLEVLYTEIGKISSGPSDWLWHLPKPDYEETRKAYSLK